MFNNTDSQTQGMGRALEGIWNAILEFFDLSDLEFNDVKITPEVMERICHFSKEVYPKEFISLLKGKVDEHVLVVDELIFQPFTNTVRSSSVRLNLPMVSGSVGSVHSHPSPSNHPSRQDLRFFSKMGGIHLIISNPFRERDIRAYLADGTPIEFSLLERKP